MGSDIRVFSSTAKLGWPHAKIGLCSIGGPSTLARAIPVNLAFEFMFSGDLVSADRAFQLVIANRVVEEQELEARAEECSQKLLRNAPLALRALKESTLNTLDLPYGDAVKYAHASLDKIMRTHDAQ